jgi:hypothetical protein
MSSRFHATSFPERFNNSINRTLDKNAVHSAGVTAPFSVHATRVHAGRFNYLHRIVYKMYPIPFISCQLYLSA